MCLRIFSKNKKNKIEKKTKEESYEDFLNLSKKIKQWLQNNKIQTNNEQPKKTSFNFTINGYSGLIHNTLLFHNFNNHIATLILYNEHLEAKIIYTKDKKYFIDFKKYEELREESFMLFIKESIKKISKEKHTIQDTFSIEENSKYPVLTEFLCPECRKGYLEIEKEDDIECEEYLTFNKDIRRSVDFDPEFLKYKFTGYLTCNKCKEKIIISGDSSYYSYGDEEDWFCGTDYQINYFENVVDFINIDTLSNSKLRNLLKESFKLYYIDKKACVNRIRCFLDEYLTYLGVSKTSLSGEFKALENRIKECKELSSEQKESFLTLKDIGNNASHGAGEIPATDIYMAYKIIESILEDQKAKEYSETLTKKYRN